MAKKFIVAVDSGDSQQNQAFLEYLKAENVGWWHWLTNLWLIVDTQKKLTAPMIRNKLLETHPQIYVIVMEVHEPIGLWSGFGPNSSEKNMFKWIQETWKRVF